VYIYIYREWRRFSQKEKACHAKKHDPKQKKRRGGVAMSKKKRGIE